MDFFEVINTRRSIRSYKNKPIPEEIVEKIIESGSLAATARNIQPWVFIAVTDQKILKHLGDLAENGRFISEAPLCIAVVSSDTKYYLEDRSAATQNMLLSARALGIASCWVAGDKKPYCQDVLKLLNVPLTFKLVSLVALGYPQKEAEFKKAAKKSVSEILRRERFE